MEQENPRNNFSQPYPPNTPPQVPPVYAHTAANPGYSPVPPFYPPPRKKHTAGWIIALVSGCVIVLVGAMIAAMVFGFSVIGRSMEEVKTGAYYSLGADQIPSLYQVVGERTMAGYERDRELGEATRELTIQFNAEDASDDAWTYAQYLIDQDGFTLQDAQNGADVQEEDGYEYGFEGGFCYLSRDSLETGKIVLVELYWWEDQLQIDLYQGANSFSYEEDDDEWYNNLRLCGPVTIPASPKTHL